MLKIAITGNIASGKSLFEEYLKSFGFKVLCLDHVTNFLYENSVEFKEFLLKKFNTTIKQDIADIIFNNLSLKAKLENFIYPLIYEKMEDFFIKNKNERFVFVSAPLLYEAGFDKYFDKIIFISADETIRLKRLIARNGFSESEAVKRIKAQMPEDIKIKHADYIIDNSGTVEDLANSAKALVNRILKEH